MFFHPAQAILPLILQFSPCCISLHRSPRTPGTFEDRVEGNKAVAFGFEDLRTPVFYDRRLMLYLRAAASIQLFDNDFFSTYSLTALFYLQQMTQLGFFLPSYPAA